MTNFRTPTILSTIVLLLAACSGDDGGVSRKKSIADATDAELVEVCEDVKTSAYDFEAALAFDCYFGAIFEAASDAEVDCEMLAQTCITESMSEPDDYFDCSTDEEPLDPPACATDVTVGEMEDCMIELAETFQSDIDCSTAVEDLPDFETLPPSCAAMEEKCPGIISSSEE